MQIKAWQLKIYETFCLGTKNRFVFSSGFDSSLQAGARASHGQVPCRASRNEKLTLRTCAGVPKLNT